MKALIIIEKNFFHNKKSTMNRYDTKFYNLTLNIVQSEMSVTCLPPITRQSNLYRSNTRKKLKIESSWFRRSIRYKTFTRKFPHYGGAGDSSGRVNNTCAAPNIYVDSLRNGTNAIEPTCFSYDRGKERGIIIIIITSEEWNGGGKEGEERAKRRDGLLITRASNQMYVNIIKQCNGCFAHEIFITFDGQHLWQTACN